MPNFISTFFLEDRLRRHRFALAVGAFAFILAAGSIPGARADVGNIASGLVLHSVSYGIITLLLFTGTPGSLRQRFVRSVVIVAVMGAIDELVQSALPYRQGTVRDWIVDCSASLVVAGILVLLLRERSAGRA